MLPRFEQKQFPSGGLDRVASVFVLTPTDSGFQIYKRGGLRLGKPGLFPGVPYVLWRRRGEHSVLEGFLP